MIRIHHNTRQSGWEHYMVRTQVRTPWRQRNEHSTSVSTTTSTHTHTDTFSVLFSYSCVDCFHGLHCLSLLVVFTVIVYWKYNIFFNVCRNFLLLNKCFNFICFFRILSCFNILFSFLSLSLSLSLFFFSISSLLTLTFFFRLNFYLFIRRFRDFSELNSQVKQNFKGHHLRSSLPPFPEKHSKLTTNHGNQAFLIDRYTKLEVILKILFVLFWYFVYLCLSLELHNLLIYFIFYKYAPFFIHWFIYLLPFIYPSFIHSYYTNIHIPFYTVSFRCLSGL